jgi:hypothetical protein
MLNRYMMKAGFLLMGILFFIWPVPGTISVRDISILLLFIIFLYSASRSGHLFPETRKLTAPLIILAVLTSWIILSAILISGETAWSLKEIQGQWMVSLGAFAAAVLAAISAKEGTFFKAETIMTLLFSILMVHVLYIDLFAIYTLVKTSVLPAWVAGLTGGKDKSSYLSHFLLMILCVEIYSRGRQKNGYLPLNNGFLFLAFLLTLFSIYLEGVRNGTVIAVLLLFVFIIMYFPRKHISVKNAALLFSVILLLFLYAYASSTSSGSAQKERWKTLLQTVPLALDTQNNKAWLDPQRYPYPKLKNGEMVAGSNYERIAWFKEGVVLLEENPLGVGYGRNAFGHGLRAKYHEERAVGMHSHSGILDFAVGTGFPGLALWMLFIVNLMYSSLKAFRNQQSCYGLLLFFIVVDFSLRMFIDSIIRDHMLEMFMFFAGLLYVFMLGEAKKLETDKI